MKLLLTLLLTLLLSGCATTPAPTPQTPTPNPQADTLYTDPFDQLVNGFPFPISSEQKDQSLMQGTPIVISPVEKDRDDKVENLPITKGRKLIAKDLYSDGGSHTNYYFKDKGIPAVRIHFKRNMFEGKRESLTISFIHPAKIGVWLLDISPESLQQDIDINTLMECDGILGETYPGVVECLKP